MTQVFTLNDFSIDDINIVSKVKSLEKRDTH